MEVKEANDGRARQWLLKKEESLVNRLQLFLSYYKGISTEDKFQDVFLRRLLGYHWQHHPSCESDESEYHTECHETVSSVTFPRSDQCTLILQLFLLLLPLLVLLNA